MFRLLFNEDVSFYYPKTDILRASDGKWYVQQTIKLVISNIDVNKLKYISSTRIFGVTSGAEAVVESVISYTERGLLVAELTLSEVQGTFLSNENVRIFYFDDLNTEQIFNSTISEVYTGIEITEGGSSYKINDRFFVRDTLDNSIVGSGFISNVSRGPVISISIANGGFNYSGDIREVNFFAYLPINHNLSGLVIAEQPISTYAAYTVNQAITTQELVQLGDEIEFRDDINSSGYGAFGVIKRVDDFGTILEIELLSDGDLYENPTANINTISGTGAVINVVGGGGRIKSAKIENFAIAKLSDTNNIVADLTTIGDGNGTGILSKTTLVNYPGRYLSDDGHLSSTKKLQDNRYYQEFSYVLKTNLSSEKWKDILQRIIHPAGLEVFGEVVSQTYINASYRNLYDFRTINTIKELTALQLQPKYRSSSLSILGFSQPIAAENAEELNTENSETIMTEGGLV